jgi:hypothetical protein
MAQPVLNLSLEEVRQEVIRLIAWLESAAAHRSWAAPMLVFAREFQALASEQPLDAVRIRDFTVRLRQHIVTHHLKGFDDVIWYAEALERLAGGHADA